MATAMEWRDTMAPSLVVFQALANAGWERLPAAFRKMCGDLIIRVQDFAEDEILDELDLETPFDLLGLYQGVNLTNKSIADPPREPDMVFLYRRAIIDEWANGDDSLGDIITHVLIHEIGHHFGFSDADMEDIENDALNVA